MSIRQSVSLGLGQSLTMTPALQQAIQMLQLSTLDLHAEIQSALESNLMLEADEDKPAPAETPDAAEPQRAGDDIPEKLPVDADWDDVYASAPPTRQADYSSETYWEDRQTNLHTATDLHGHLTWQAELHGFADERADMAAQIIDAVDNNGYLHDWAELQPRLCRDFAADPEVPASVLRTIQDFDPPGVGARTLAECLQVQLAQLDMATDGRTTARQLVTDAGLEALAAGDRRSLLRLLENADESALDIAIALIRTLQPHPGEHFDQEQAQYIVPEVFVVRHEGRWQVALNSDIAPRLRINPQYMALVKRADTSADQSTLKTHLQEARFFLNSLRSRNETLLRVAQCIVAAQRAFLEYGPEAMKPLILKDVADELEMHESTISRATANKYIQTPRGLFALKYFFSSHVATTDGGVCSATAIQAMIRRLIADEPVTKPLSDNRLAELLLQDEGIRVARRTVAKYREALSIPSSSQRRRSNA